MKGAACGLALVLLASCEDKPFASAQSKPGASASNPSDDLPKKFVAHMESAQEEVKALKDDIDRKRVEDAVKPRLAAIRRNVGAAQEIPYPKQGVDSQELRAGFSTFLGRVLKGVEEATWDEKNSTLLWKKLQTGCAACHQQFRD